MFVLLLGCASIRPISTHSPAGDNIEQSDIGVILSLADFHFDPFYDPKLFPALAKAPPSEWTRIFESSQFSGYGEYGKDSNYNLVVSALKHAALAAPGAAFILPAGDWLAHGFSDSYYLYAGNRDPRAVEFIDKTIIFLTQRIREQFPHIPIYPALGNVDSYCGDYQLQPKGEFLRRTAETWKGLLHDEQAFMQSFPTGGYYPASAPGTSKHRIVILNTVFFSTDYRNQCGDPKDDPGGDQLRWLAANCRMRPQRHKSGSFITFRTASMRTTVSSRRAVTRRKSSRSGNPIARKVLALLDQYRDTIQSMLAGHTHMDYFRLGPYGVSGRPSNFCW
jgi:hypothetical protein